MNIQTEIKTVYLYRDINYETEPEGLKFRATDYFSQLVVKEQHPDKDSFCSIMSLGQENIAENDDTSMQCYTLYFNKDIDSSYCEYMKESPFETNADLPFLSIIQIHITTESLRRIEINKNEDVIGKYEADIVDILKNAVNIKEQMIYRVYRVLSGGDFAVVVRSKLPETSFKISSLLRGRMAGLRAGNTSKGISQWALYKTYTLLAFDETWMENDNKNTTVAEYDGRKVGEYVIRGCFSYGYWKAHDIEKPESDMDRLNGRYDFSIVVSEVEFRKIYKFIKQYKGNNENNKIGEEEKEGLEKQTIDLVELAQNGHISYLNIRYMVHDSDACNMIATASDRLIVQEENNNKDTLKELREENALFIQDLKKHYTNLSGKYMEILESQQNAEQYFRMLGKTISSCSVLNEQSDTRIYAVGMEELLEIVLKGMDVYLELHRKAGERDRIDIARLAVDYIRIAVHSIDNYLGYIRNNNLQSLQTPNYNIESNMGMEKILIAYSEFLKNVNEIMSRINKDKPRREFYPIVIPDLCQPDICVETLFANGYGVNYAEEKELRDRTNCNSYMMVIGSPTLSELGDLPIFTAMLFHELAHQHRYELRTVRNETIRSLVLREYANVIAASVINFATHEIGVEDERDRLKIILSDAFYEELDNNVFKNLKGAESEWDTPLVYFWNHLRKYIMDFNVFFKTRANIINRTNKFVKNLSDIANHWEGDLHVHLACLYDYLNNPQGGVGNIPYFERLEGLSLIVAGFYAIQECDIDKEHKDVRKLLEIYEQYELWQTGSLNSYEEQWKIMERNTAKGEKLNEIRQIWEAYVVFIENCIVENDIGDSNINYEMINKFKADTYKAICKKWTMQNETFNNEEVLRDYRDWTLLGRYLQIDNNKCQDVFWNRIGHSFDNIEFGYIDSVISKYREITSDIAMYSMMDLTPFQYIKIMTTILSKDDVLNWFSVDRVITVISVMECVDENEDKMNRKFKEKEKIVVDDLGKFCENMQASFGDKTIINRLKEILNKIKVKMNEATSIGCSLDISEEVKAVEKIRDAAGSQERQILVCITKIVSTLERLWNNSSYYIHDLIENEFLLDDYRRGADEIGKVMNKEFVTAPKSFYKMSKMCRDYIGKKHYKTGMIIDNDLNIACIDFMLELYYERKIRNSRWLYRGGE